MRVANKISALLLLPMFFISTPALAGQSHIVDQATMAEAMAAKVESDEAKRDLVRRVLEREEVRETAARLGLSLEHAGAALATLDGEELAQLAAHASQVEEAALAGGRTIVISVTTLLLLLIIVILLAR